MEKQIRIQMFISVDGKGWTIVEDLVSEKVISVAEVLAELDNQGFRPFLASDVPVNPPVGLDAEKVPSTTEVLAEMDKRGFYPLQFDYRAPPPGHRFLAVRK